MKRISILIAGAAVLMALPSFAGINPNDPGLPQGWTTTKYTANFLVGNTTSTDTTERLSQDNSYASAFCVECHGLNPSALILTPEVGGGVNAAALLAQIGSHTVADAIGDSNTGGGYVGGSLRDRRSGTTVTITQPRTAGQFEKLLAWGPSANANNDDKGLSKYGITGTETRNSTVASAGDMICESCHNVLVNAGDQMLLEQFGHDGTAGNDKICLGCHGAGASGGDVVNTVASYANFHDNGNLSPFLMPNTAGQKNHHVMNGDALDITANGPYNPDADTGTNDSIMWAPSFTRELVGTTIGAAADFAYRDNVNLSGQGTYDQPLAAGDIGTGTTMVMCNSCHRPHNAMTKAAAYILKTGTGGDFTVGAGITGIETRHSASGDAQYVEYLPLCAGCHQGYD